jgi:hypothetical protein
MNSPGFWPTLVLLAFTDSDTLVAQVLSPTSSTNSSVLLHPSSLPGVVGQYLQAFGDRIYKAGNERSTLVGTYTDKSGSFPAQLTWEAPGNIRFELTSKPGSALVFSQASGTVSATVTGANANVLESLLDDAAESFLYNFQGGSAYRLLGRHFRADDGKATNYQGPWYDIYSAIGPAKSQPGNPTRVKQFFLDSQTGLLAMTRYVDTSKVPVVTEFGKWSQINGQAFPGQIVRKENGVVVFTFAIANSSAGPSQNDGIFAIQ